MVPADSTTAAAPVEYREVPGFPGYQVGNDGSVWTCRRKGGSDRGADRFTSAWRLMRVHLHGGYCRVNLIRDGKNHSRAVHCLVLEAFVGPCPPGMEACHYPDADKANNRVENLRWDTHSGNMRDRYRDRPLSPVKVCRRCRAARLPAEFYRDVRSADGLKTECKACHGAIARSTRDQDKKRRANRAFMRRRRACG
jgi:hypothetical protein